jgi:hypothetical protein
MSSGGKTCFARRLAGLSVAHDFQTASGDWTAAYDDVVLARPDPSDPAKDRGCPCGKPKNMCLLVVMRNVHNM